MSETSREFTLKQYQEVLNAHGQFFKGDVAKVAIAVHAMKGGLALGGVTEQIEKEIQDKIDQFQEEINDDLDEIRNMLYCNIPSSIPGSGEFREHESRARRALDAAINRAKGIVKLQVALALWREDTNAVVIRAHQQGASS